MPATRLMILWHMHQPYYKDLVEDRYAMPWVRLHALKDYYGMVAMIKDFPSVHMAFNLVPSLVAQLLDYAQETAHEESYDLAFKPAKELTPLEKGKLLKVAFQINHENLLSRYPRFRELFKETRGSGASANGQDLLDLQVLSQLAWFDEIYLAHDPEIKALVARQRDYTETDKRVLRAKEAEILKATLEEYEQAAARGQIEISTSPFYHPILPLLCDTNAGAESSPGLTLPRQRFRHPEDARDQLQAAMKLHEKIFGRKPRGFWPSEGSVSEEALRLAAGEGLVWTATDEGVLSRSLGISFHRRADGTVDNGHELYQPHGLRWEDRAIALFFRDHQLSDLIGFVYSRMDPAAAAQDLIHRIRAAARSAGDGPAVVSIILDGENAWEYFPGNGREFLKRFYAMLSSQPDLQAMTPSEILSVSEPRSLGRLTPGSWINANFNIWIGADEDNRAWDLLSDARNFYAENAEKPGLGPGQREAARQEVWIAEGSDWCWWYGPEHSTAQDEEFDLLYRKHLSNLYRLLGGTTPDELAMAIKRPKYAGRDIPPTALIHPVIDGRETTYFEWLGAGVYTPDHRSAALHESGQYIKELFYGHSDTAIYLRVDLNAEFLQMERDFEIRLSLGEENRVSVRALVASGSLRRVEFWRDDRQLQFPDETGPGLYVAYENVFELEINYALPGLQSGHKVLLQVSFWVNQLPVQILPKEGWLTLELSGEPFRW